MNSNGNYVLISEIEDELGRLATLEKELNVFLTNFVDKKPDSYALRAIGSILHDFYCGLERIFRKIALEIDESLPKGDRWYRDLLKRMTLEIKNVRPLVISPELLDEYDEFLRFRHLFRNVYGYELKWKNIEPLCQNFTKIKKKFIKSIRDFIEFFRGDIDGLITYHSGL